jgi:hypothetical protein
MAIPANSSKMSENLRHVNQGARPADITENQRIAVRNDSHDGKSTGESRPAQNSENKRIATIANPQ